MGRFSKFTLQQKITAVILATSCIVLVLSSSIFFGSQLMTHKRLTVGELNAVANITANNVTAALVFDDPAAAEETLTALRAKPGIELARIYTTDGQVFAQYVGVDTTGDLAAGEHATQISGLAPGFDFAAGARGYAFDLFGGRVELYDPISLDGEVIGTVFISSNLNQLYSIIDAYLFLAALVVLFLIIIAFLIAARLQKIISEPVLNLLDTMRRVSADQDYSARASSAPTNWAS